MKKMWKKMVATLLVVLMAGGAAPLGALAEMEWLTIQASAESYSGSCGDNVTWSLDTETCVLSITGTGAMKDYASPWHSYGSNIRTVTIDPGVTSIGAGAFYYCTNIESVVIPDSVTNIGYEAFRFCKSLNSITIPNNVTSIGDFAFADCTSLTDITIGSSVVSIGMAAFSDCKSLNNLTIPASVKNIGDEAFHRCMNLVAFTVDPDNCFFSNDETGVLYNKDKTVLIQYPIADQQSVFTIPESVTDIGNRAFEECRSLSSVMIPDSVTSIGSWAFAYCYLLANIAIPSSVQNIGAYAFYYCTSFTNISLPANVATIQNDLFAYCECLENVSIPESVTLIEDKAFYGCTSLKEISVDQYNSVYSSDTNGILYNKDKTVLIQYPIASSRTSLTIPASVTNIGYEAFKDCSNLTSVTIPNGLTIISDFAFYGCNNLESVTIPDGVTSIGSYAFGYCESLPSVTVPSSVTNIGNEAFANVGNVLYTGSASGSPWGARSANGFADGFLIYESSERKALCACIATVQGDVTIPNSVTSIGNRAFYNCAQLESISIGNGLKTIGYSAFENCKNLTYIAMPEGITSIEDEAFAGCESLQNATIPDSVTEIGDGVFCGCTSLQSVVIGNNVPTITAEMFCDCKMLNNVEIGNSVTNIGTGAFYLCSGLENITIPNGVTSIGNSAFANCTALTEITMSENLTVIDNYAFHSCTSLKNITIPDSVTNIGERAFIYCIGLESIIIGNGLETIESMAFSNCMRLTSITIPDTVTNIAEYAFAGVCNIVYHGLASGSPWGARCVNGYVDGYLVYESSDQKTLYACSAAATGDVSIPDGVISIGNSAFACCTDITNVLIPDSVTSIGNNAFSCCTSLTSLIIPDEVISIGANAFYWCASLSSLTIGRNMAYIGESAFSLHLDPRLLSRLPSMYNEYLEAGIMHYEGIPLEAVKKVIDYPNGSLTDVYYQGIQPQWSSINVEEGNEDLLNATIHYVGVAPMIAAKDAVVGCSAGRLVKVRLDIHNPGIIATRLHIGYDAHQLRLVNVENGTVFDDSTFLAGDDLTTEPYTLLWSDDTAQTDNTTSGTLVTLVFEVQDSASIGDSEIAVAIDADSTFNAALQQTHLYAVSGMVHIVDCTPGDASGEGKISLLDSVMISRYLAGGWNVTINEINADVNGDGNVDLKDVVLIRRFLAGWNVELI